MNDAKRNECGRCHEPADFDVSKVKKEKHFLPFACAPFNFDIKYLADVCAYEMKMLAFVRCQSKENERISFHELFYREKKSLTRAEMISIGLSASMVTCYGLVWHERCLHFQFYRFFAFLLENCVHVKSAFDSQVRSSICQHKKIIISQ